MNLHDVMKPFGNKILLALAIIMSGAVFDCLASRSDMPNRKECDALIGQAVDALWSQDFPTVIQLMTKVRKSAYGSHWDEQYFWALSLLGMANCGMYNFEEGGELFRTACEFADRHMAEEYRMKALSNLSTFYIDSGDYQKARTSYLSILGYAKRSGDRELEATAYMNLGNIHRHSARPDSALLLLSQALSAIPDSSRLKKLDARIMRIEALMDTDSLQTARTELSGIIRNLAGDSLSTPWFTALSLMARLESREDNHTQALHLASSLDDRNDILRKKERLRLLADLSQKAGDFRTACLYNDTLMTVEDSIANYRARQLHSNSQIKFVLLDSENRLARQHSVLVWTICVVILSLIIVAVIIYNLRNNAKRHHQTRLIAEQQKRIAELELQRAEADRLLLRDELESSNREMTTKSFSFSRTNDVAREMLQFLESSSLASTPEGQKACERLRRRLYEQGEPDDFLKHFEKVNSRFMASLHAAHPDLTANDVRFIVYIYMQLSNKEISSLLNITSDSCKKRRQRLATKLGLENATKLYPYLSTL